MNEELFSMQHFQIYISSINYFCFNVSPLQEFTTVLHLRGSLHLCISTLFYISPISTLYISKLWIFNILQFSKFIICFITFILFVYLRLRIFILFLLLYYISMFHVSTRLLYFNPTTSIICLWMVECRKLERKPLV